MPNASRMWVELPVHDPALEVANAENEGNGKVIGAGCAAVMAAFYPDFDFQHTPARYLFLVDRSASMAGEATHTAQSALLQCLHALPPSACFDLVGFGTVAASLFGGFVANTPQHLHAAAAWAMNLNADLGATMLWEVVRATLLRHRLYASQWKRSGGQETPSTLNVVLLTDGVEMASSKAVLRLLQEECPRSRSRVFLLVTGDAPCRSYCQALVRAH